MLVDKFVKQIDIKQGRKDKLSAIASKFEAMRTKVAELEKTEQGLVESVQHSRNW